MLLVFIRDDVRAKLETVGRQQRAQTSVVRVQSHECARVPSLLPRPTRLASAL